MTRNWAWTEAADVPRNEEGGRRRVPLSCTQRFKDKVTRCHRIFSLVLWMEGRFSWLRERSVFQNNLLSTYYLQSLPVNFKALMLHTLKRKTGAPVALWHFILLFCFFFFSDWENNKLNLKSSPRLLEIFLAFSMSQMDPLPYAFRLEWWVRTTESVLQDFLCAQLCQWEKRVRETRLAANQCRENYLHIYKIGLNLTGYRIKSKISFPRLHSMWQ